MTSNLKCPPGSTATEQVAVEQFSRRSKPNDLEKTSMQTKPNNSTPDINAIALRDAYGDFILSRQAVRCSQSTLEFYRYTARKFILWAEQKRGVTEPGQVNIHIVRAFLAELGKRTISDWTLNDNARAIRTILRFWHTEGYIPESVVFEMPKVRKKKMLSLSANELGQVISTCETPRDKALIMFMADSGLRRAEVVALDWKDLNMENGLCRINSGKGGKSRVIVVGASTRQAMLEYRVTLSSAKDPDPLIQSQNGTRFTPGGLLQIFRRLSKRGGIHVTPHSLRRTFVKLSLRAKMSPLHLKDLLGHESLEMVMYYAGEFDEEELIEAHKEHSPIENLHLMSPTSSLAIRPSGI